MCLVFRTLHQKPNDDLLLHSILIFVKGLECNDQRFEILEGLCVNPDVPGAIPNWVGAPAYKLLPKTEGYIY